MGHSPEKSERDNRHFLGYMLLTITNCTEPCTIKLINISEREKKKAWAMVI